MLEICIALFFAYLLLNHIYRLQEGLANDPLSPQKRHANLYQSE